MTVTEFLPRLQGVRRCGSGWSARCPAHADRSPSLSVTTGGDGRVLLHDHGGCRAEEVVGALGLRLSDLFPPWDGQMAAPRSARARPRSLLDDARARVLAEARRQAERLAPYRDLFVLADSIRARLQLADCARRAATALGSSERIWDALTKSTRLEVEALAAEVEMDEILAGGRIG